MKKKLPALAARVKVELPSLFLALKDRRTSWLAKLLAFLTVAYALSPVDLIPDFIPVIGYLDDLLILPLLAALTIKLIPADVWQDCLEKSQGMWESGKPKKWYYALPIIIFWLLILFWIGKMVYQGMHNWLINKAADLVQRLLFFFPLLPLLLPPLCPKRTITCLKCYWNNVMILEKRNTVQIYEKYPGCITKRCLVPQ